MEFWRESGHEDFMVKLTPNGLLLTGLKVSEQLRASRITSTEGHGKLKYTYLRNRVCFNYGHIARYEQSSGCCPGSKLSGIYIYTA
jgi:hypothetical protein